MDRHLQSFRRMFLGLLLASIGVFLPLRAQLDPRLQASKTDFLDLYQKSTTAALKPEVVTVFDFSGSMQRFMFHPLYVNTDRDDNDGAQNISFTLHPAVAAGDPIPQNNTYTIYAISTQDTRVYAQINLTVDSAGGVTASNSWAAYPTGSSYHSGTYFRTSSSLITVSGSGTTRTLTWTMTFKSTSSSSRNVNPSDSWSSDPSSSLSPTSHTLSAVSVAAGATKTQTHSTTWTVPAYVPDLPGTPAVPAYVTSALSASGLTTTFIGLVKPDGTLVTESDADGSKSPPAGTPALTGLSSGKDDVRNWVRAASHVRFSAVVGSDTRTLDIPLPWKITDANSTGNPLTSRTVLDKVIKKGVTYGSGLNMELDTSYQLSSGGYVLSGNSTTVKLAVVDYVSKYIGWAFSGKYADGTWKGKYIVFDAANASLVGGQGNVSWGQGWGNAAKGNSIMLPTYNPANGAYVSEASVDASKHILPGMTRAQAVKRAAIETWIANQASVLWAFRFLDPDSEGAPTGTTIQNNSASTLNNTAGVPTSITYGTDSAWTILNNTSAQGKNSTTGNSVTGMKRLAIMCAGNSTPLTYATANALAQFNDPNNVFKSVETGTDTPSSCMAHFLIVFTDGNDNNNSGTYNANSTTPYLTNNSLSLLSGNQAIIKDPTLIDRYGKNWNIFTFAAVAAHLSDTSIGTIPGTDYLAASAKAAGTSDTPSAFLPFAIKKRDTVDFGSSGHRITTMTLGVSLGGYYTDDETTYSLSGKRALFRAALLGDPTIKSGSVADFHGFDPAIDWIPNPDNPSEFPDVGLRNPKTNNAYFFDGSDPEKLVSSLKVALANITGASNVNSVANPNLPFIGASLGKQVYLGKFVPPTTGGPIWSGDLLMFATQEVNGQTKIIDNSGTVVTKLDASTAQWSAANAMSTANRLWSARKLYTRLPGDANKAEYGLTAFGDIDTAFANIKDYIMTKGPDGTTKPSTGPYPVVARDPAVSDTTKQAVIQRAMGADSKAALDANGRPTANRSTIMGDIIDSSPSAISYTMTSTLKSNLPSALSGFDGTRFRMVLTGTNQGWLHAFGEVTKDSTATVSGKSVTVVQGKVDELWSFMPTDFLGQLDYVYGDGASGNNHRFMVDGAPIVYHLDLPPSTGGSGNGTVDSSERAIAIFGLRKGGRSYYAIDIHDPFNPTLKWSLCPDEADYFPSSRIVTGGPSLTAVKTVLATLGLSTTTPALGRLMFNGIVRDAVFFGGGFSTADIEANFMDKDGAATKLGRSVIALDVYTGEVLAAVDMTTVSSTIGCIPAGLIPFEFFVNSGMAQRAYFMDYLGGLWSWGSGLTVDSGSNKGYRIDSSELTAWTVDGKAGSTSAIRKVAQDGSGNNALYSTAPVPFRVGTFLGTGKTTGTVTAPTPAAVGVAMISGDRNNPVDTQYTDGTGSNRPSGHRLTVVFDRQDSGLWGLDTAGIQDKNLINVSSQTEPPGTGTAASKIITPGSDTYFLTNSGDPYFGYYMQLGAGVGAAPDYFIPKGISEPMVVAGSLFYSYFTPTTLDVCKGGDGQTDTNLICDVYRPMASDSRTTVSCVSGTKATWQGVASTFSAFGTRGVIQGGAVLVTNPPTGASKTAMDLKTIMGANQQRFPKPRVWRTVH